MIWNDKKARIPFAALGVFLLIGSTTISVVMVGLENENAKNVSVTMKSGEIEKMLASLKNDLAICLNYAGLNATKYVGRYPVIQPNPTSPVAWDYAGHALTKNRFKSVDEQIRFNLNWTRNITRKKLNLYIEENYIYDTFNNGRYAINVEKVKNWRDIKVREIYMNLDRKASISLFTDKRSEYPVYWIFYVPLNVEIKDLRTNQIVSKKTINISSLIPSRLPLLMQITEDFQEGINNSNILNNKLFLIFTLLSEIYTEGRALVQYGGEYEKIPNIVDNRWLRYLLNGALLFEEFMFFNSIDPITAIKLILNWRDLTATGFPEEKVNKTTFNGVTSEQFSSIFKNPDDDLLGTISNKTEEQDKARKKMDSPSPAREINITEVAESLLYDRIYNYIYYNETCKCFHNLSTFSGYEVIGDDKKVYYYVPPPPYYYYNETQNLTKVEKVYKGRKFTPNNIVYHIVFNTTKGYTPQQFNRLNKTLVKKIDEEINNSYTASFVIKVERWTVEAPHYINKSSYWDCRTDRENEWKLYKKKPLGNYTIGGAIKKFPYTEEWEVEYRQKHTYGHETLDNGSYICEGNKEFAYVTTERIKFTVYATYPNVNNPFYQTDVKLSTLRHDNNLFYISKDFVEKHFIPYREEILEEEGKAETTNPIPVPNWSKQTGPNIYAMEWIKGINGEVATALKEILKRIKEDNITASIGNDFRKKNASKNIDDIMNQLLEKYKAKMYGYIDDERYKENGKYKSCGARVVAKMRKWYVNEIENELKNARKKAKEEVNKNLNDQFDKHGVNMDKFNKAKDKLKGVDANNLPSIQFGLTLPLHNDALNWKEEIGFSIDQNPDYLTPYPKNGGTYKFLEKNICVFGPTGLPILPTPITPWIITINAWYIEIQGGFSQFKVVDTVGEMHPDMLFGETDQAYVREDLPVKDPCNQQSIGETTDISFVLKTANVAIVPPGFVGDINPTSYPVEIDKYEYEVKK